MARSESRQALRTVVRNPYAGDFSERTVRLCGVADQFRRIAIDLVEMRTVGRDPDIAGTAAHRAVEGTKSAIARNPRARRILGDFETVTVDAIAADVAVAKIRRIDGLVVRCDSQPAQFRRQPSAGIDLYERADLDLATGIDRAQHTTITDGGAD